MASRFSYFDFYLLRLPRFSSGVVQKINTFERKEEAWNYIVNLLDDEILDAIYLASAPLFKELTDVLKTSYTPSVDRLLETLYKYISRMSTRPTPYGKFSGVSVGELCESTTSLKLSGEFFCSYRLDMGFTTQLSKQALENPEIRKQLGYYTNSTLYDNIDYFKYIDFNETENRRSYQWAKVNKNPLLEHILNFAKEGKHFHELVESLKELGIDESKAEPFVHQLIGIKLLICELEPCVTRTNSNDTLSCLKTICHEDFPVSTLLGLERCLKTINTCDKNVQSFTVGKVCEDINLSTSKNIIQADMLVGTTSNHINKRIIEEIIKELEELSVINKAKIPNDLISFRKKFVARYGDREIPLLEAIDPESGIGYGEVANGSAEDSPLIQGFGRLRKKESHNRMQELVHSIIVKHEVDAGQQLRIIELDYEVIKTMRESNGYSAENVPLSFYLLGNLLTPKNLGEKKSFQFNLIAGGGVSSVPLLTRFAHIDSRLGEMLRDCVAWDEEHACDVILAEIVYMPESRVGNILTRPMLYKYEIPIVGQSAVKDNFRISLNDLWISIKGGQVILRSKRLNKQVIPRLSSAHNFHYGMVVYRFLCDLQFQSDSQDLSWDWGILSKRRFLPRISYKHIILSRATWNISRHQTLKGSDTMAKIHSLKEQYGLPDLVQIANGDNELLIDIRSPIGGEILLKELSKHDLVLHEYLFDQYESPVCDSKGAQYNNEILIPLKVDKFVRGFKFKSDALESVRRSFHPGSEWVFMKIYCGTKESDKILSQYVAQLKNELSKEKLIEKWFFIRYHDPDPHIRLRFLLRRIDGNLPFQQVISLINKYLEPLFNSTVFRIVYDTYERELQRYGENNIELCESIFHTDSEMTLALLPLFSQTEGSHLRWLIGMRGVDYLFASFGLDIAERITFLTKMRDSFLLEFNGYDKLKYKLDCKYREYRNRIQNFFDASGINDRIVHDMLFDRFRSIRLLAGSIKKSQLNDHDLLELLSSLSHMYINRLFPSKQREHEMILYHFLVKYYNSVAKRKDGDRYTSQCIHDNFFL